MGAKFPSTVPADLVLVMRAASFAAKAHKGQTRKYTGEPYITHPLDVAMKVAMHTMDPHVIAAALLHDVVEDTPVTIKDIEQEFGLKVGQYVEELTDQYTKAAYPEFNRAQRKKLERDRIATISAEAQLVKLMDLVDNSASIFQHDPDFAKVYAKEKALTLDVLTKVDSLLVMAARSLYAG